jgi:uroporphyrinogen decarboxylase
MRDSMLARDRFTTTMEHREPDRVPIDLGGEVTGISIGASAALKRHLGIDAPDEVADRVQQLAIPHDGVLERLHVDSRYYYLRPSRDWHDVELSADSYQDEFGMTRRAAVRPDGRLLYYDMVSHPLSEAKTVEDIARYSWPDPHDPARFAGLEEMVRAVLQGSDKAVTVNHIASAFEFSWYLRGLAEFLTDLMTNRKLAEAQLDAMLEYQCALTGEILDRVGGHLTFISTGSDLGTQRGPLINPEVYRSVIWPRYRKLWEFIRARTDAKIFYHSCGSIVPIIPLLIEGGVDAIHPVQPGAAGMGDRIELKRRFGADITFWGGFDQQDTLPFGTPDQVRTEARRLLDEFMPGGGFVFAAGHNIQADVPAENILALFDAVEEYGRY